MDDATASQKLSIFGENLAKSEEYCPHALV